METLLHPDHRTSIPPTQRTGIIIALPRVGPDGKISYDRMKIYCKKLCIVYSLIMITREFIFIMPALGLVLPNRKPYTSGRNSSTTTHQPSQSVNLCWPHAFVSEYYNNYQQDCLCLFAAGISYMQPSNNECMIDGYLPYLTLNTVNALTLVTSCRKLLILTISGS